MDLAATSLDAYALFSTPRDHDAPRGPDEAGGPPPVRAPRKPPIGWLVAAFYGLLTGAFMLGVTAGGAPLDVARCSAIGFLAIVVSQAVLLRRPAPLAPRLAQGLTTPALALAISGLGALARLSA
jgi:hypothetical protein